MIERSRLRRGAAWSVPDILPKITLFTFAATLNPPTLIGAAWQASLA